MIEVVPAIMPRDLLDLKTKILAVRAAASWVQVDMMDGVLTPVGNWPLAQSEYEWKKITSGDAGLPYWEDVSFEADLIVNKPERVLDEVIAAGFARIIFHARATTVPELVISKIKEAEVECGVALWVDDDLAILAEMVELGIDTVQIMGIEKVGFQGQPFSDQTLEMVRIVTKTYPDLMVQVDGSVNDDTFVDLLQSGVDRVVVGSEIFGSEDPIAEIEEFYAIEDDFLNGY